MYPEEIVQPFRAELTSNGFSELRTREDVNEHFSGVGQTHRSLVVINSICGCAAGIARPGVLAALTQIDTEIKPHSLVTVFAGQDQEATGRIRELITQYPPSSPSVALFEGDTCLGMVHRNQIEGSSQLQVAQLIVELLQCETTNIEV